MIAVFSLMRRREGIDIPTFQQHWMDPHGVLVCGFPGLQRYSQNRIVPSDALSAAAAMLRLDGIAELAYDNDEDQEAATASEAMAACDVDSPLFIGAVVRIVTQVEQVLPPPWPSGLPKLIALFPPGSAPSLETPEGAIGHLENITLRQRGPKSAMPVLDFPVGHISELWFETHAAQAQAAEELRAAHGEDVALFAVDELRLV